MRTVFTRAVLLVLATAFLVACTSSDSSLTPEQRGRLSEEYIDGPLSD